MVRTATERETMETKQQNMPWQLVVAYYGPTDYRGARHKVTSGDAGKGGKYFHYEYAAGGMESRDIAAAQYMAALGYAPDQYKLRVVAVYIINGRRHTFYSVTRRDVEQC
jgi:hypothetical protein